MSIDQISARIVAAHPPEDNGAGQCLAQHDVEVCIGDKVIAHAIGWRLCGWIHPDAHENLEGSALNIDGGECPRSWMVYTGDGNVCGDIVVQNPGGYPDEYITVGWGQFDGSPITPDDVPAWREALDDDDSRAEDIREMIVRVLTDVLEFLDVPPVPEPESKDIYDCLPRGGETLPHVRIGDWEGAGTVIAWQRSDGEFEHVPWPDLADIKRATDDV